MRASLGIGSERGDHDQGRRGQNRGGLGRRIISSRAEAGVYGVLFLAFAEIALQLCTLALSRQPVVTLALSEPVSTSFSRPDIVDRNGRLLATDLEVTSIFADPALIIDRDEAVEKLGYVLPELDGKALLAALEDRSRRFTWVRRGVSPKVAQAVHDLGIPGIAFRDELKRAYPAGDLAGHVLGTVNIDNRGVTGVEKYIDDKVGVDPVHTATLSTRTPVRLSLDLGVQHALEDELDTAVSRYHTQGAAGVVLNIKTGEVLASASLPTVDPRAPGQNRDEKHVDRVMGGTYELGSVFKTLTLAMAFDAGLAQPSTVLDVRQPLEAGRFTVKDFHPSDRPLSVAEIYTHSSNVGAGMLALQAGAERVQKFFRKIGVIEPLTVPGAMVAAPQVPPIWNRAATITVSYGHGIAVAPLQFAAAAATLLNGGKHVTPTLLASFEAGSDVTKPVVTANTSRQIVRLMRLNVTAPDGTGKQADVPGYQVGGKTGTADVPGKGGYQSNAVITSFLGAFPMDDPQYLTFVMLFEPTANAENQRTAGTNAAPVTARLISRIAGQLGVTPQAVAASQ